jgi:hypothetical protein
MEIVRKFLRCSAPSFNPSERGSFIFVIEPVRSFADIFIERPLVAAARQLRGPYCYDHLFASRWFGRC